MSLLPFLHRVAERESLNALDARLAMGAILAGEASEAQIAGFVVAMKMKGVTAEELVGFARAMRRVAEPIELDLKGHPLVDTCGTGGDGASTFNISTISAFVLAGAGVFVAKHGNRSISGQCGSADLMEMLGVNLSLHPEHAARAIREVGIGFLFAPAVHTAMRHAQPVRAALKMRTVFNLLGPLTNPAPVNAQVVGAPSEEIAGLIAAALSQLGLASGYVVHGSDGLDEVTTTGSTIAFHVRSGHILREVLEPEDFGVETAKPEDLKGGDKKVNYDIAQEILHGGKGPKRDAVLVNAALALNAAGRVNSLVDGVIVAARAIDDGSARKKLKDLSEFTKAIARSA
jgi:anthranilate phosphoribosyltransferase